ncbi:MAG: arginine ABC transporter permease ArtQ [Candidatus Phlomobacter fragariae]
MNNLFFLINAAGLTITLAGVALILGLLLAVLFTAWESVRWRPVTLLGSCLMTLIRGLPELLVILFVYYGTLQFIMLLSDGIHINFIFWQITWRVDPEWSFQQNSGFDFIPFFCSVFALALLYGAYASQTLRGALKAIPSGQWESGQALGLNRNIVFLRLIMPQMWRHALPGLGNQWLVLLKDTALVSLISVNDLMLQTKNIVNRTHEPFTWYLIVALIYLAITLVSQFILRRIELRTTQFEREVAK